MWKKNWAATWWNRRLAPPLAGAILILAGCSSAVVPTPPPTQTLFPVTLTFTPLPAPPTATHAALPGPEDIATATPEIILAAEGTPELDPVAGELVRLALRRLSDELDLPTLRMRVIEVRPVQWTDSSLGCALAGQTYTPVTIDGYRIVIAAAEREYIFHSDFDRVLSCEAANEQLPEAE